MDIPGTQNNATETDDFFASDDHSFKNDTFLESVAQTLEVGVSDSNQIQVNLDLPVPELYHLSDYLAYARQQNASDLHISAIVSPFIRRFGCIEMIAASPMSPEDTYRVLFEGLNEAQKQHLMEHKCIEFCLEIPEQGRYRCSIIKQRLGWDGAFHIIRNTVPSFEELQLPESLKRLTEYQQGLVLVTGAANSGKTTTLAALLDVINANRTDHIITIERPIEYVHKAKMCQVTQREVLSHTESFATALRAALRQDPDVLMVGELTDLETLSMAISASETGHLVCGTLYTTTAARTVNKILDGFPVAQQSQIRTMLSESLRGIVSQQLIPSKDGRGVALAMEILLVTPGIASLLRDNKAYQIPAIMQTSQKMGMCLMDDSIINLVKNDVVDEAVAVRYTDNKDTVDRIKKTQAVNGIQPVQIIPEENESKKRSWKKSLF